jgi:hypothetical protein
MLVHVPYISKTEMLQVFVVPISSSEFVKSWIDIQGPTKVGEEWQSITKSMEEFDGRYKVFFLYQKFVNKHDVQYAVLQ